MKVLLCGHRSFASRGLVAVLRQAGHEVVAFAGGAVGSSEDLDTTRGGPLQVITGPVQLMHENPHLCAPGADGAPFDAVVNYILLKDDGIDSNVAFVASLLRFCREQPGRAVAQLIHISSISSYKASTRVINESAEIESVPQRKGSYGSLKVATDLYLLRETPATMKLSLVRPGFVLGAGLANPIVGTAARLPWGRLLVIGHAASVVPMTTRDLVNEAVARVASNPPAENREVLVLADPESPSRRQFLEVCCRDLGLGTGVSSLPTPLWWLLAVGGELVARLIGQAKLQPYSKLTARLSRQRYESGQTSARLAMSLAVDWRRALQGSLDGQDQNFPTPGADAFEKPASGPSPLAALGTVTFLGFGKIVRQKYLPALRKLGFSGQTRAFDLIPAEASAQTDNVRVDPVAGATIPTSGVIVVATPGRAHIEAIGLLRATSGAVLVEKPLCYSEPELIAWSAFAAARPDPVYVCHNYRLKQNVLRMMNHLARFNPGRLHHAELLFQSPPVGNDSARWRRDERRARTLLTDYGIHFLDIACLFGPGESGAGKTAQWEVTDVRHRLNSNGQTELIEGRLQGGYSVHFLLRQGLSPRRARVRFSFQNYTVSLGFFPDTFVAYMADDNPWVYKAEASDSRRQTLRKIVDKLRNRDSDESHARLLAGAADGSRSLETLTVASLGPFYSALFKIGDAVYGQE